MQKTTKRTPRACERCRQSRRRCEPPYPCRQCAAAGVVCDVRSKARPQRRQHHRTAASKWDDCSNKLSSEAGNSFTGISVTHSTRGPAEPESNHAHVDSSNSKFHGDTFDLLRSCVQKVLLDRYGYSFKCSLLEPPSCRLDATSTSSASPFAGPIIRSTPPLDSAHLWNLLTAFRRFIGWQDTSLIDVEDLHATARAHSERLLDTELASSRLLMAASADHIPIDTIALIFAALALGAISMGELGHARSYFDISIDMAKHFTGQSTLDLCLTYFLQHNFALRSGTSNYAQEIVAQAIRNAHDLGLQLNSCGIRGLQLYLLIYMADQYCSLTYSTEPIIRTTQLQSQIFAPLIEADPQLQKLVDLVTINGYVIEHSPRLSDARERDVLKLEAKISSLCCRMSEPPATLPACGSFRDFYEPLARVHMLCCRLKLRAPGLTGEDSWLASLCICVHAAQGILSTYFQLYLPVLKLLANQCNTTDTNLNQMSSPIACRMGATWRQVKRIMMSAFVVIYAYWHSEMVHEEASRYITIARVLLEYPRWRWGEKVDEALQTLVAIARLSDFDLQNQMENLLPGASERFPRPVHCDLQLQAGVHASSTDQYTSSNETHEETLGMSWNWPKGFDLTSTDFLLGSNIETVEGQTLIGLWESLEQPMDTSWLGDAY